jgi:prephenate dehydrogenase
VSNQASPRAGSVGIVGLGLIGGSIGLALRNPNRIVLGCDVHKQAESDALERFCIDRVASTEEVSRCDVVFLGVPPNSVCNVLADVYARKSPQTVVSDCCSVKTEVAHFAAKAKMVDFVPGHPMAGHEKSGSKFASAWLFKGARWILTPNPNTRATAVRSIKKLVEEAGAKTVQLGPDEHDRHVAVFSHLPHVLAGALLLSAKDLPNWEVAAGSWRDLTRVGGVVPKLWSEILYGNRQELGRTLEEFCASLTQFRGLLEAEDELPLADWLAKAKDAKKIESANNVAQGAGKKPSAHPKRKMKF